MSTSPRSGTRELYRYGFFKYYNIPKWENSLLQLKAAKNTNYIEKCFK